MYTTMSNKKIHMVGWLMLLTLIFALFITTTVFAEGEEPTAAEPAPTEMETSPPEDNTPPEETQILVDEENTSENPISYEDSQQPSEENLPEEQAEEVQEPVDPEADETSPSNETPIEDPSNAENSEESSDGFPEDTDSTQSPQETAPEQETEDGSELSDPVDSEDGETPLASADPYYSIGSTVYRFYADPGICAVGDLTCFDNQGSDVIQDALDYMEISGLPSDRTLYVEKGSYDGFTVNGSANVEMSLLNAIIGVDGAGWDGDPDGTYINGSIQILDNLGGFKLSGFTLNSYGIFAENNSGTLTFEDINVMSGGLSDYGIQVMSHNGAIVMNEVSSMDAAKYGAHLDNTNSTLPVTIKNSSFYSNGDDHQAAYAGLYIITNGSVTLNGVSANQNNGNGIELLGYTTLTMNQVVAGRNSWFSDASKGYGILAENNGGSGKVSLDHVYAPGNAAGIYIDGGNLTATYVESWDNTDGSGFSFTSGVGGNVRITYSKFNSNGADGLSIETRGPIYLYSIAANENGVGGVWLSNEYEDPLNPFTYIGNGSVTLTSPANLDSFANSFNNNGDVGITILSRGTVSLMNFSIVDDDNSNIGLVIDNTYGTGSVLIKTNFKSWYNEISNNSKGIDIQSNGTVTITDTFIKESTNQGITVTAGGNIILMRVIAYDNDGLGAYLSNIAAPKVRTVTLTDCIFNLNGLGGLEVQTMGKITATGLSASINSGSSGALLDNSAGTSGVTINPGRTLSMYYIGANYFNGNDGHGLDIQSNGSILIKNINANSNGMDGLHLDNPLSRGSVSIDNKSSVEVTFNSNTKNGIYVRTFGNITMKDINANENTIMGANLDNCQVNSGVCQGFGSINILADSNYQNTFSGNQGGYGLKVLTGGTIKAYNIEVNDNDGEYGAILNNCFDGSTGSISVLTSGKNVMNYFVSNGLTNWGYGLFAYSNGNITVKEIYCESNPTIGAFLTNELSPLVRNISITNGYFYKNGDTPGSANGIGLEAKASGNITITGGSAVGNYSHGALLGATGNVTIKGNKNSPMLFSENGWEQISPNYNGIQIDSSGKININYVTAYHNNGNGIFANNTMDELTLPVSMTGITVNANEAEGLRVQTKGAITVKGITASGNQGRGATLQNNTGIANVTLTITGGWSENAFNANGETGLSIESNGNVSITNAGASDNGGHGIFVDNQNGTGSVTYSTTSGGFELSRNGSNGFSIDSKGAILIKNKYTLIVDDNATRGIIAENYYASTPQDINIKNILARGNGTYGVELYASRNLIINNLSSSGNSGRGAHLNAIGAITITGTNTFKSNGLEGLYMEAYHDDIRVTGVLSSDNAKQGIYALANEGDISIMNSTSSFNGTHGVYLYAENGTVTLSKVYSILNGFGSYGSGIYIKAGDYMQISIKNCSSISNYGSGIEIFAPEVPYDDYVTIYNTYFFGNLTNISIFA